MKEQTAVEWMARKLGITSGPMLEEAKQMEREQMEETYDEGKWSDKFAPDDSFSAFYNKQFERNCDLDYYEEE